MEEAQQRLLACFSPLDAEPCPLDDCLGRVLAEDLISTVSVPPFANSAMDGFAFRSSDTRVSGETVTLQLVGTIGAGSVNLPPVDTGEAVRIMTGAPLPDGTDSVVPIEETTSDELSVTFSSDRAQGACVRQQGLDIKPGENLLPAGTRLGSAQIALAASLGTAALKVRRRPTVAILATGDELVEVGQDLGPGQIYNSNAHGLAAAVRELGAIPVMLDPARDDADALAESLRGTPKAELILTSGGVSVGEFDFVKDVIARLGSVDFWRVRMRPGKPLMFGEVRAGSSQIPVLGLPGNPTSTMVTFFVFGRPIIRKLLGERNPVPRPIGATTTEALDNRGGRETYFRTLLSSETGEYSVRLAGGQDSSMLMPLARANALVRVPWDVEWVEPGSRVDAYPL